MIRRYNNLSFLFFIPGIIIQVVASMRLPHDGSKTPIDVGTICLLTVGALLCITGFAFYAKAKGRNIAWGLFGMIGLIGALLLSQLKDQSDDPWNT